MKVLSEKDIKKCIVLKDTINTSKTACHWVYDCICSAVMGDCTNCPAEDKEDFLTHAEAVEFWEKAEIKN